MVEMRNEILLVLTDAVVQYGALLAVRRQYKLFSRYPYQPTSAQQ